MVTIQISLPEELAGCAKERGLLEPEAIAQLLRTEIRRLAFDYLLGIAEKLEEAGTPPMTPEEVQAETRRSKCGSSLIRTPLSQAYSG
jgi:hypothetical protein